MRIQLVEHYGLTFEEHRNAVTDRVQQFAVVGHERGIQAGCRPMAITVLQLTSLNCLIYIANQCCAGHPEPFVGYRATQYRQQPLVQILKP